MFSLKGQKNVPMTTQLLFALDVLGFYTTVDI